MATRVLQPEPSIVDLDVGTVHPFYDPGETADACINEAHALLTFMAEAHELSQGFGDGETRQYGFSYENTLRTLSDDVKAQALRGVARILATARHLSDVSRYHTEAALARVSPESGK